MSLRWPRSAVLGLAAVLVVLAGVGDRLTGDAVAFTLVYLVPVALASWGGERSSGLLIAAAAALSSYVVNRSHVPELGTAVQAWNLATELGVYATMATLLASLRRRVDLESERALTDPLTGLRNRRAFQQSASAELERARRHAHPFTLAVLDLDDFKQLNDALGHGVGDEALAAVAGVLRHRLRVVDLAARLGGDEFALLLPETTAAEADTVFRDLQAQIGSRMRERAWPVGLSLGAVTFASVPRDLDEALREADARLYEAKRAGKGCLRHGTWPSSS
jgi:diguanylate cyclase (GGDEF)-like protein